MHTGARAHAASGDNELERAKNSCYLPSWGSVSFKTKQNKTQVHRFSETRNKCQAF